MKTWLLTLLLLGTAPPAVHYWLTRVRAHNTAQAQGQLAARQGRPVEAAYYYQQAVALAGRGGPGAALLLDLAQAQAQAGQAEAARATYAQLLGPSVPAAIGSTARQQLALLLAQRQQVAQAIGFLRQALRLNPGNATARYNYELLSQFLADQQPDNPPMSPPTGPTPPSPSSPKDSTAQGNTGQAKRSADKRGNDHPGEAPAPAQPQPNGPAGPHPDAAGQPDRQQPAPTPGSSTPGGFRPGAGPGRPLPSGSAPGSQHGFDVGAMATGPNAAAGRSQRPGLVSATNADLQLQTQRERLKAMNLSPAQAQQLLDALRESEQQYLQQRPRARQGTTPTKGQPTW